MAAANKTAPAQVEPGLPKADARQRKQVVPPETVTSEMSLFDYLENCRPPLHRKIADIACSQRRVPPELREDAVQEIFLMWTTMKPDTAKYKPGQVAAYAHQMAKHAALRLRREIGSAVRLPGSAFRKRRDGTTYVTPGVLASAMDWNELEGWFQADGLGDADGGQKISSEFDLPTLALSDDIPAEETEEQLADGRMASLKAIAHLIDENAYRVMERLIQGFSHEEIQAELGIKRGVLMRHVTNVAAKMVGV